MESQRRQSDRINAELKRELEQTMAAREEQSKDMDLLRRQSDRINTELKRDLEQTMALSEDLKNQLREMSNSREETREEVQSLQKHAAKLEAALQEHDHDIALQKTQVRNAQGRIASLERELDTAQVYIYIHTHTLSLSHSLTHTNTHTHTCAMRNAQGCIGLGFRVQDLGFRV